jgi:hypothetical protein
MIKVLGACAVMLLASGCASIVNGSTEQISVTTDPVAGANCELKNSEGTWQVTTPGTVEVNRARSDLNVTCTKDGYPTTATVMHSKMNFMTFGNVLAGGVIGVMVDSSTGANTEYETPINISLTGTPSDSKAAQASRTTLAPGGGGTQ